MGNGKVVLISSKNGIRTRLVVTLPLELQQKQNHVKRNDFVFEKFKEYYKNGQNFKRQAAFEVSENGDTILLNKDILSLEAFGKVFTYNVFLIDCL